MNYHQLAFSVDSTVPPCRWIASLSDGTTVFENYIPQIRLAWMRLKAYLAETGIEITRLRLQCGDQLHNIPPGADAYFILKQIHRGVVNKDLTGIGLWFEDPIEPGQSRNASVIWFDLAGNMVGRDERDMDKDHDALIFVQK